MAWVEAWAIGGWVRFFFFLSLSQPACPAASGVLDLL